MKNGKNNKKQNKMKNNKNIKKKIKKIVNNILINYTLAKFIGAVLTVILVAILKYLISGNFHIEYCEFWNNAGVGLLAWTINTTVIGLLTEYLGIKGINFNLNQFINGKDTMSLGDGSSSDESKAKLYNTMDTDGALGPSKDKGKGIDRASTESEDLQYESDIKSGSESGSETETEETTRRRRLDKGKGIDRVAHPFYQGNPGNQATSGAKQPFLRLGSAIEPPFAHWYRLHPGVDPQSIFFPKKINPGPGFNVPGGEVPIRDDICKHIDYNTRILSQFKKMDLETAIEQRDNNLKLVENMKEKLAYAQNALSKVPTIPTTEYEFRLRNQILKDLDWLNITKDRGEARATLLNSRIQFIEINLNLNQEK
jgi:hypothetical protein